MNLPPALAPWAPFLEGFPLELAPALGEMARRLAQIVGPSGADFGAEEGEIDGYDGLSRRGSPDRMLMSDWLLASEAPDEWARRAAENELSFLQIARKLPRQSDAVAAIFDAGPSVLGAPRLGQLAALLVLARRAREMGAILKWGIAQKHSGELWQDATPSGLLALVQARGAAPVRSENLEMWREKLADCEEIWLVGAREIEALASPREAILRFEDPFEDSLGTEGALDVKAWRAGAAQNARLPLPGNRICTQLLRNPLGTPEEAGTQVRRVKAFYQPQSNLVWLNGHTLGAQTKGNGIAVFRVPSSPRGGVAKPKHYPLKTYAVQFVGEWKGAVFTAALSPKGLKVEVVGGKSQNVPVGLYSCETLLDKDVFAAKKSAALPAYLGEMCSLPGSVFHPILGGSGCLYQVRPQGTAESSDRGVLTPVVRGVAAASQFAGGVLALTRAEGEATAPRVVRLQNDVAGSSGFKLHADSFTIHDFEAAFWGGAPAMEESVAGWGVLALQLPSGWKILWSQDGQSRATPIPIVSGEQVLGVIGWRAKWPSPALLILSEDGCVLMLRGYEWSFEIAAGEPILSASVSLLTPFVAWQTSRGVSVHSLAADAILARWEWEAA